MKAATALFLLAAAQAASAASTDAQLENLARQSAERAASAWNVPVTFAPADDGYIRSLPSGDLKVPLAALRSTMADVPDEQLAGVIGWLMAHEVWHQVQFKAGTRPAGQVAQRQFECVADIMAAQFVTGAALRRRSGPPSDEEAEALGTKLKLIMTAMERAEGGYAGILNHPAGDVREMAIRSGAGRATFERLSELAADTEERLALDRLATIHDIQSGESAPDWASRTCRMLLHGGDGSPSLVIGKPNLVWNENGDPPIVDYVLPFKNRGAQPIRVMVQVRSATVPRAAGQSNDITRWTFADARKFQFDLEPGATHELQDRFSWYATDDRMPRLLYPGRGVSFYDAVLLPASQATPEPVSVTELPTDLMRLKGLLQTFYNDGPNRFRTVAPPCVREEVDGSCPVVMTIPGAVDAFASRDPDGSSEVDFWLYEGRSESDATSAFRSFLDKLTRLYPALRQDHRTRPDGRESVDLKPAPQASLSLVKRKRSDGESVVIATIVAKVD